MTMPEASVHEYDNMPVRQHEIGRTGQVSNLAAKVKMQPKQQPSDRFLGTSPR